jgi:dTMP kinase
MTKSNGVFITLEGGEGAGKSTLLDRLGLALQQQGRHVVKTREPGGSKLGEFVRQWLLNRDSQVHVSKKAELLLFLAARAQHIEELIQPALDRGDSVICDRFNDSTIAYQGVARGLGSTLVEQLCSLVCGEVKPNLTLFLDVDLVVGLARTRAATKENATSGEIDRIEAEALPFHAIVREAFHLLAQQEPHRIVIIDANRSQEEVFDMAWKAVKKILCKD